MSSGFSEVENYRDFINGPEWNGQGPTWGVFRFLAWFFSIVFHPLLVLTQAFVWSGKVYGFQFLPNESLILPSLGMLVLFTFVAPATFVFLLFKFKAVKHLSLDERTERHLPYFLTAIIYGYLHYVSGNAPDFLRLLIQCGGFAVLVSALVNLRWKISAHAIGMGGLTGILLFGAYPLGQVPDMNIVVLMLMFSGLVMWSRLWLQAHNPAQVYTGWVSGFIITFLCIKLLG